MDESILKYRDLTKECDLVSKRLYSIHNKYIVCKRGCCGCCVNLSLFPVEFYSILDGISRSGMDLTFDETADCGFLDGEGSCTIYKYRPIICRTHGLPIAFSGKDGKLDVSFCELNFAKIGKNHVFDKFNTLNIDKINDKFFAINIEFITRNKELGFSMTSRIPIQRLLDFF